MTNFHNYANSFTIKSLLILQFNANGLKNHANKLEVILYNKPIGIAFTTKTYFTEYTKIFILGFKSIHTNHPHNTAHGGVAIFIRSPIVFQHLPNFSLD